MKLQCLAKNLLLFLAKRDVLAYQCMDALSSASHRESHSVTHGICMNMYDTDTTLLQLTSNMMGCFNRVSATPGSTGNILEFEIPLGNTGILLLLLEKFITNSVISVHSGAK